MSVFGSAGPQRTCLFIQGTDSVVRGPDGQMMGLGSNDLNRLINDPTVPLIQFNADIYQRSSLPAVRSYRCLINLISDADRNRRMLEHLDRLLTGFTGRIINPPSHVLKTSRDQVARRLAGIPGVRVPKVVRLRVPGDVAETIERAGLSFPIILRRAGTHGGQVVGLFDNMDDLRREAPSDAELFATEFVDYRSRDGLYRKFRVCVLGRTMVLRHMIVSDQWNVHGRDRRRLMLKRPKLRHEERDLVSRPRHALPSSVLETLKAVRRRMPLDYFGVDFGIDADGMVVLFEANATMDYHSSVSDPEFDYVNRVLPMLRRAALGMIPELTTIESEATPATARTA